MYQTRHSLLVLLALAVLLGGCAGSAVAPSPFPAGAGKVHLSILFPARRTIPQATESILITATGSGILAEKPFRKGYARPPVGQTQQLDAELILPLGAKVIRAEARDVSASDAEKFNSGNTLASTEQPITLLDKNFFEPVALTLNLVAPTLYRPSISWKLVDYNGLAVEAGSGADFTKSVTRKVYYDNGAKSSNVTTTITASLAVPQVAFGTNFNAVLTLTRSVQATPVIPGLISEGSIKLDIPNTTGATVRSRASASNPNVISLTLAFRHVGGGIYELDETANPGFQGYVSGTFLPQGSVGGYNSNWNLASYAGTGGITLNGNVATTCLITPAGVELTASQFSITSFELRCNASFARL